MIDTLTKTFSKIPDPVKQGIITNILIVDDRPENLISLASFLEQDDRNIIRAQSGNEALKISLENEIALILLGLQRILPLDLDPINSASRPNNLEYITYQEYRKYCF